MNKIYIDLTEYFNHRMVYPEQTPLDKNIPIGIDNHFFHEESFVFDEVIYNNGGTFVFKRDKNNYDNIVCAGQEIKINYVCKKIQFAGFTSFGEYKEKFILKSDTKEENCLIAFSQINDPFRTGTNYNYDVKVMSEYGKILFSQKIRNYYTGAPQAANIYFSEKTLDTALELNEIIFPDNMFMNVFAITIYGEE